MAGYEDTRQKIISTLMGRPNGTEIQPENHQDYALNMLDYIRGLELIATSTLIGVADENTTPVQPNSSRVCYIAGVAQNQTVVFENFIDENGNPISVTTGDMEGVFVILMWNTQYWSSQTFSTNIISHSESATFYYRYNIRKTYESIALMNADVESPIGTDGKYIKVGDIVTVVNSTTPSENGIYSYEGDADGWKYQSSFNFQVEQVRSQDTNTSPSSKLFDDELTQARSDLNEIKTNNIGTLTNGTKKINVIGGTSTICTVNWTNGILTEYDSPNLSRFRALSSVFKLQRGMKLDIIQPEGLYITILCWSENGTYLGMMRGDFLLIQTGASQVVTINSAGTLISTSKTYDVATTIICQIVAIKSTNMTPSIEELYACEYYIDDIRQIKDEKNEADIVMQSNAINNIRNSINGQRDNFAKIITTYENGSINPTGQNVDTWGYQRSLDSFYLNSGGKISVNVPIDYYVALHCWNKDGKYMGILRSDGLAFIPSGSFTVNAASGAIETVITTIFKYDLIIRIVITNKYFSLDNPKIAETITISPELKVFKSDITTDCKNMLQIGDFVTSTRVSATGAGTTQRATLFISHSNKKYAIIPSNDGNKISGYIGLTFAYTTDKSRSQSIIGYENGQLTPVIASCTNDGANCNLYWECQNDTDYIDFSIYEIAENYSYQKYHNATSSLCNSKVITRPELTYSYLADAAFDGKGNVYVVYAGGTESLTESYDTCDCEMAFAPTSRIGVAENHIVLFKSTNSGGEIVEGTNFTKSLCSNIIRTEGNNLLIRCSMVDNTLNTVTMLYRIYNAEDGVLGNIGRMKIKDNNSNFVDYNLINIFNIFNTKYGTSYNLLYEPVSIDISYMCKYNDIYYMIHSMTTGTDENSTDVPIAILSSPDGINWEIIGKTTDLHKWNETSCWVKNDIMYISARADEDGNIIYFLTCDLNGNQLHDAVQVPYIQGNSTSRVFEYNNSIYISGISRNVNQFDVEPYNMPQGICIRYDSYSDTFIKVFEAFTPGNCHPFLIYNKQNTLYAIYTGDSRHLEPVSSVNETDIQISLLPNTLFSELV